jgi:pyrimidine-nucleoside phosphorylase
MRHIKYDVYSLIDKKKTGQKLSNDEINWFIQEFTNGSIPDYQMSAMLMAMFLKGLDTTETASLTDAMLNSGKKLKFAGKNIIDKHSTGGIGDKTSFILAPIAVAAGVKVPMIAGRSLGFTGGTIDKIEAIKGFQVNLDLKDFSSKLQKHGMVLIGQTPEIAPADRLIYALRDVTATIDSIPLITASIMSKKLAEGANGMVFDIKTGSGAFMREKKQAKNLAKSLIQTASRFNKKAVALITDMDQPLGQAVGHTNEIIESIETLKNQGPQDLTELSLSLAAHMIHLSGKTKNYSAAYEIAKQKLENGEALEEFRKLIKSQGGDPKIVDNYGLMPLAAERTEVLAPKGGYLARFQNSQIGLTLIELGGGRKQKSDTIDHGVGFIFHKKIGDQIKKNEPLLTIYHHQNQRKLAHSLSKKFTQEIIHISSKKIKKNKTILEEIRQG